MQPYPRSPDLVWPGQRMARAASLPGLWTLSFLLLGGVFFWFRVAVACGFSLPRQSWLGSWAGVFGYGLWCCPSFAGCLWCSLLGLGFSLHMGRVWLRTRSACPPPFPAPLCGVGVGSVVLVSAAPHLSFRGLWGVRVLVRPSRVVSCTSWLGLLCGGACLCARPACSPPFLAGVRCVGVRAGPGSRLCPAILGWVVGVCFLRFFFWRVLVWLCGVGCWLSLSRAVWSLSPHPLSFGLGCWLFLFLFLSSVVCVCMFWCPFSRWAAVPGLVLPVSAGWSPCASLGVLSSVPSGWGVWPPLVVLAGGLMAVGCSLAPPPPHPVFFWGGVCLFLPLSSLGWRTHWPAFSVVFRAAVGGCVLFGRVPAPWVGWAMYTLGSAPLPAALGPGSASWAAAPGGCVWLWVRGLGLSVSFLLCGAGFTFWVVRHRCCRARGGPVCGPRCRCVAYWCGAFRGLRWLVSVSPSG